MKTKSNPCDLQCSLFNLYGITYQSIIGIRLRQRANLRPIDPLNDRNPHLSMYFCKPFLPNMPRRWDFGGDGGYRLGPGLLRWWGWIPLEDGFGSKRRPYPWWHLLGGFPEPLGRPRLGVLLLGFGEHAKLQAGLHGRLCLGSDQWVFLLVVIPIRRRRRFCDAHSFCFDLTTFSVSLCIWYVEVPNFVSGSILTHPPTPPHSVLQKIKIKNGFSNRAKTLLISSFFWSNV